MSNLEVIALDTVTPQLRAPGAGDGYAMPRPINSALGALTSSTNHLNLTETWNGGAAIFNALNIDITYIAADVNSYALAIRQNGVLVSGFDGSGNLSLSSTLTCFDASLSTIYFPGYRLKAATGFLGLSIDNGIGTLRGLLVSKMATQPTVVASLGSAAGNMTGGRSFVTDATLSMVAGIGTVVVGGGANKVPVYSDGANWLIG